MPLIFVYPQSSKYAYKRQQTWPQHDKKISADLFKQNAAQFSLYMWYFCFCFIFFFVNVIFYVFCVDAAGLIFWGLSLYNGKRPAPKISKVWAIHCPYRNALYKYVHTRICPLGQAKLQCCNSKIIKCNAAP